MGSTTDSNTNVIPQLCNNNCGFFGSNLLDGFCSQCYTNKKKSIDKEEEEEAEAEEDEQQGQKEMPVEVQTEEHVIKSEVKISSPVENLSLSSPSKVKKKYELPKKVRCPNCKKAMGILQYPCACGGHFCSNCRYSLEHQCPIDYKALGRKVLAKNNPQVVADRVQNRQ